MVQIDVVKAGAGHSPEFIGSPYEFWVGSHVGVGTSVGHVKVNHLDPKYTVYDLLHSYYEGGNYFFKEKRLLEPGFEPGLIAVETVALTILLTISITYYVFVPVPFAIEERTGVIAVVDDLSKYTRTSYEFEAYVTDSRHTLTTNVSIHIVDPHESAATDGEIAPGQAQGQGQGSSPGRREPIELKVR